MSVPAGKVSILDGVGATMRAWRIDVSFNLMAGAASATVIIFCMLFVSIGASLNPSIGILAFTALSFIYAGIYTMFLRRAAAPTTLFEFKSVAENAPRVWAAMAIVGLFLFLIVLLCAICVALSVSASMSPAQLQSVQGDEARAQALMLSFLNQRPWFGPTALLLSSLVILSFSTRFYLAAPGTLDMRRIKSLDAWKWTRGAFWKILASRLLLMLPSAIVVYSVPALLTYAFGYKPYDVASEQAFSQANAGAYFIVNFIGVSLVLGVLLPLDAILSTYFYKRLKPAA
jgi:hypothetical protein